MPVALRGGNTSLAAPTAHGGAGAGLDQTLKSTSGASTGQVFTELGYALPLNARATVEPFAGAAFSDQRLRGFSESGGFAALDGESKTNDVTTTLGLHAQMAFTALQLQAHLHGNRGRASCLR
ncbi:MULTISPECIES: autotransporter outer membrane beta-barrel domain-containing protein [unclassified Pseudomonas]|uniref:autotransporter outer membrane beta-barrel domain-containing protein n=1 Tax=unclassified Pseudomonas TaxID=196821 RepID=UPI0015A216BC|nr:MULTISPECIES: autotransporter outer membrane beta-barrel domain-containing protein [unclassified Pseudomonas]NWC93099.1 autotransporter outer membrane beta-barrel domain-containing protein [Pseudomonas sp. IPO3779]NWD19517.1 autotransporter outer membrane beta-barrel domain-containing protein [Pseudomonas sp. IPO3778]